MKFINYIEKIAGVDIYGIVSLVMFVLFFVSLIIWVVKTKKETFNAISRIPLDN